MNPTLAECANIAAAAAASFPGGVTKAAEAVGAVFAFRPSVVSSVAAQVAAPDYRAAGRLLFDASPQGPNGRARAELVVQLLAAVGAQHVQRPGQTPDAGWSDADAQRFIEALRRRKPPEPTVAEAPPPLWERLSKATNHGMEWARWMCGRYGGFDPDEVWAS